MLSVENDAVPAEVDKTWSYVQSVTADSLAQ